MSRLHEPVGGYEKALSPLRVFLGDRGIGREGSCRRLRCSEDAIFWERGSARGASASPISRWILRRRSLLAVKEFFPAGMAAAQGGMEVVPEEDADEEDYQRARESFRREAELLARFVGTEGIVTYRDYLEENGTAYLVMDYVEGPNLKQALRERGRPFTQEEALELMKPILLAVDAMHRKWVIHRDISPENLIRKPDGTLTLIDFGAAREFSFAEQENLTVIVKRGYAPEEQYHSGSRQGPWTDLYACCAVLYQLVSGILPQDAAGRRETDELVPLKRPGRPAGDGSVFGRGGEGHDDFRG